MRHLLWTEFGRRQVFGNHIFKLILSEQESADGRRGSFMLMECPDWVNVVALLDDRTVVMVRQYRFGAKALGLEFPGGIVEPGEDLLVAAKRELLEETGYTASNWLKIGEANPNPSFMANTTHCYLARGLSKSSEQNLDPNEIIDVETVDLAGLASRPDFGSNLIMLANLRWFEQWRASAPTS